ncbi:hypothetical protein NKG05_23495 [Oerskovia sp. M15]
MTEAAQAVQRSGFPDAYAQHETRSRAWASALTGYSEGTLTCELVPVDPATLVSTEESLETLRQRVVRDLGDLPSLWRARPRSSTHFPRSPPAGQPPGGVGGRPVGRGERRRERRRAGRRRREHLVSRGSAVDSAGRPAGRRGGRSPPVGQVRVTVATADEA